MWYLLRDLAPERVELAVQRLARVAVVVVVVVLLLVLVAIILLLLLLLRQLAVVVVVVVVVVVIIIVSSSSIARVRSFPTQHLVRLLRSQHLSFFVPAPRSFGEVQRLFCAEELLVSSAGGRWRCSVVSVAAVVMLLLLWKLRCWRT